MNDQEPENRAESNIQDATGQTAGDATSLASSSIGVTLAMQHMMAAARFSRMVASVERQHAGESFAAFWDEIFHLSTASVFACAASLEAYANELFFNRTTVFPGFSSELRQALEDLRSKECTREVFSSTFALGQARDRLEGSTVRRRGGAVGIAGCSNALQG